MPPKKEKDRTDNDNYWRFIIEESPLNEDIWEVKVILFETAGSEQETIYLNNFETYAKEEKRFVIKNICKSETMFMVNQLGAEKKVKDENLRVFEEGHLYLKEKKDIPSEILALIIKHLILKMKEEYLSIQKQKFVVKEGMRKESLTMVDQAEVKNKAPVQNIEPVEQPEPPKTKTKGKKDDNNALSPLVQIDESKKYSTLLRLRGEEWRDKVYVDDYPLDGPNLYLAITGFLDPYLLESLMKIGVPLTAIVQIRIDPTSHKISSGYFTGTKRGHSASELAAEKSFIFWETLQELRLNKKSAETYKDMAFIVFNPPYRSSEVLSSSAEHIYDELSFLMYDIQDLTRQHIHYLDNMDVKCIPTENKNDLLMNIYCDLMHNLPTECTTIFSIIDSILQTISFSDSKDNLSGTTSLSTDFTLMHRSNSTKSPDNFNKADTLINKVFDTLSKGDFEKKSYRITCGEEYDKYKDPVIIKYGDCAQCTTFHLENVNLDDVIWSSLINMPICNLWQNQIIPTEELQAKVNFHISALLTCFDREDIDDSLLNRLIHILSFRKLYNNRSSLKKPSVPSTSISEFKKIYLKRSTFAEPLKSACLFWASSATSPPSPTIVKSYSVSKDFLNSDNKSDSEEQRIEFLFDCPDLSELVSAVEIINKKPVSHLIDDYDFFEDFSGINALQVLFDSFTKFNCLNYKYCEVTDSFVMMFYNNHDNDGISREEWRCHLPTPVCLQDFFDFILEEQFQWIQDEEKLYDEYTELKSKLEWHESLDQVPKKSCIENVNELDSELLIKGSLKYQERIQCEDVNEEEVDQSNLLKSTLSSTSTADSKSSRKSKAVQENKKKIIELSTEKDNISTNNAYLKRFSGYNLGERRVEVFGKDSIYFSKDGTKVYSFYTIIIPKNLEYLVLNIITGNGKNEFWMQKRLGDIINNNNNCNESFRIISNDHVIFYLKKNPCEKSLPVIVSPSSHDKIKLTETVSKTKIKKSSITNTQNVGSKFYHSFFITWPNGLIIESVNERSTHTINHIKQFYVSPVAHINEDMRCISLSGEVVIFRNSGIVEVFRPDGTYIKILKCAKRLVFPEASEESRSTSSSDKGKKGKGKNKSKDKFDKPPSIEGMIGEANYELYIDEFEITNSNGLKQKWINNELIRAEKLLTRTATDYCLGEVFSRRMDGTNMLFNKDGICVATFYDNTRIITTYYIEDEEIYPDLPDANDDLLNTHIIFGPDKISLDMLSDGSKASVYTHGSSSSSSKGEKETNRQDGFVSVQLTHTIENVNFATVCVNKANGNIVIESPNKTTLTVDTSGNYDFFLDKSTSAYFDGNDLSINFEACSQCESSTKCTVYINNTKSESNSDQPWLIMKDSFGKNIIVDDEGAINVVDEENKEEVDQNKEEKNYDKMSGSCVLLQGKCMEMYDAKMLRFFVFNRDFTCSELVHRMLIDQYKNQCRWQPWCSINNYDTFGDHRSILSLLTPMQLTETEKWMMRSKYSDKPQNLKYKDLKEDTGKGFYHWMRPYGRFQPKPAKIENIELPRLPRAYVLRTLEQLWDAESRDNLKGGKEIVMAVLRYRRLIESESQAILQVPIKDSRSERERQNDNILQEIAERIYEDLRNELSDDIQNGARPTITTKGRSSPQPSIFTKTGEVEEGLGEKQASYVREVEAASPPSANLQRYWRMRAEEAKEEEFFKQLLREESIPPYFRNMLGGAVWWEVNNMAGEAVTTAEDKPCVCTPGSRQSKRTNPMEATNRCRLCYGK